MNGETLDRISDTQDLQRPELSKEGFEKFYKQHGFYPIAGGEDETFTQEQVDEAVNTAVTAETAKHSKGWYEGLSEENRNSPTMLKYKDGSLDEVIKGHSELEKRIGLKGVLVPSDGSSDQVKADFYKAIGRPELAEAYANPSFDGLHEGVKTTSEQDLKLFKEAAFKHGLSSKQFDGMHNWYLNMQSQRLTEWDKLQETEKNEASTALRQKWGASYDERLALATGLIKKFGSESLLDKIGSDPAGIEFLANLGSQLSEDKLGELGGSHMGLTPEAAKVEINKVTKQIMETDQGDPLYQDLLNKKNALYKIAYGKPTG